MPDASVHRHAGKARPGPTWGGLLLGLALSTSLQGCIKIPSLPSLPSFPSFPNPFGPSTSDERKKCPASGQDCRAVPCCQDSSHRCYEKNDHWASCKTSCAPGELDPHDPPEHRTPWSCNDLTKSPGQIPQPVPGPSPSPPPPSPQPLPPPPPPDHVGHEGAWTTGTWTTGYWDCCKPSCSWPGKGNVDNEIHACHAETGAPLSNKNEASVCHGGQAASCANNAPFQVSSDLSMGFAAVAVGGDTGLQGDINCGQCYELKFVDRRHPNGNWGGAHPDLVNKRMIVQVSNIGHDINGMHSFDLQIPAAGQGIFHGCRHQYPGLHEHSFDCGIHYGGCPDISGCNRLPPAMQAGCRWRYEWLAWNKTGGQTNNPYIAFRRVQCPHQLTSRSGSKPLDDGQQMLVI